MSILFGTHAAFAGHDTGPGHPESARRLVAAREGVTRAGLGADVIEFEPRRAELEEIQRVHPAEHIASIEQRCQQGGDLLDTDTVVGLGSYEAALYAAGAGLDAVERLRAGDADAAFVAVRPPGHHTRAAQSMGFCVFNNVAIVAASLIASGERVVVLDWDAHHGNGTQEIFYETEDVLFISLHQYPLYPGTGALGEVGTGKGRGRTINVPFPARTSGDAYRLAFDELVVPVAEAFSPTWLLVSAGFDGHRDDPLTNLGLVSNDFADLTTRACHLVAPGRRLLFLEGGYDFAAIADGVAATLSALAGADCRGDEELDANALAMFGASPSGVPARVVAQARKLHEQAVSE